MFLHAWMCGTEAHIEASAGFLLFPVCLLFYLLGTPKVMLVWGGFLNCDVSLWVNKA